MAFSRRKQIRDRAGDRCEYCRLPQRCTTLPHEVDHIRARKHRGPSTLENSCWACAYCNSFKSSNAAGYDPETDELVPLFNPRVDRWTDHFAWREAMLLGKTAVGRATIDVLRINRSERAEHRRLLLVTGELTPE
jgi:5-methylcytosine-specific restriction endonuclease McrA